MQSQMWKDLCGSQLCAVVGGGAGRGTIQFANITEFHLAFSKISLILMMLKYSDVYSY